MHINIWDTRLVFNRIIYCFVVFLKQLTPWSLAVLLSHKSRSECTAYACRMLMCFMLCFSVSRMHGSGYTGNRRRRCKGRRRRLGRCRRGRAQWTQKNKTFMTSLIPNNFIRKVKFNLLPFIHTPFSRRENYCF